MEPIAQPALVLREITKRFPGVLAIDDASLELYPGEVHALVGENGAGKSTLSAIAFGELQPDAGSAESAGSVGLVHQHFELVGRMRVWQNVVLGREPRRGWQIDADAARALVSQLASDNGLEIDTDAFVDELPVGIQQRVELLRELARSPDVLLLDEPTAALSPVEIDAFFATITALAARGTAIMIVTHKLQEVLAYSTRVSVMRHGRIVESTRTDTTTLDALARAMVGGDLPSVAARAQTSTRSCVRLESVTTVGPGALVDADLHVDRGEIVGIAGVEGNGQSALADVLTGMLPARGTVDVPARIGVIPQDRHREALVLNWSIVENVMLGRQHGPARKGASLDLARARADAQRIVRDYDVRTPSIDTAIRTLSGGNQQKVVVGRALLDDPEFVVAYNPTRGIDVGAAALVQSRLIQARNAGAAILLISFELDEIMMLSDRILVMYRGAIVGEFVREEADRGEIGRLMAGGIGAVP